MIPRGDRPSGETRRVFAAVFPPRAVLESLGDLRRRLEPRVPGLRWVAPENLHYTLRFLGDRTPEEVEAASRALDRVAAVTRPFPLELGDLGVFPGWPRPRVLWVGAGRGSAILEAFARTLEREFRSEGLGAADKPFVAHLTLGRWRDPRAGVPADLEDRLRPEAPLPAFDVREAGIIRSVLGPGGSTYTPLHVAPLEGSAAPE